MTADVVALWAFLALLAAVIVPAFIVSIATAAGAPISRLSGSTAVFWSLLLTSAGLAAASRAPLTGLSRAVLFVDAALALVIIGPRIGSRSRAERKQKREPSSKPQDSSQGPCRLERVNEGGGTVPYEHEGHTGRIGWHLGLANYYMWTLSLDIEASGQRLSGKASATGEFAPWYSFKPRPCDASSSVTATMTCADDGDECAAIADGGQDQTDDGDFSSAVVIKATNRDSVVGLEVEVAAAVAGQVAFKKIGVSAPVAGVSIGPEIELPQVALDKKRIGKSFTYQCRR